ncbi:MAG: M48 family metalloprotease [Duncaniella sp.]|nr:M48 family metalloprotease [Duncaniella sp.]
MKPSEFIHPEDAAALRQLEGIPGFPSLVKKFYALGYEKLFYGTNMASNIRLSENQLPELYRHLPPICKKLGIPEPEFYLEMNPIPNAYTFGDTHIFITVTSGLVEMMTPDELDAVLAHECGHILCRHVLYHNMANLLINGADAFGLLGMLTVPIKYALLYWQRKSELSCDRAGAIVTSPETIARVMVRLAGGPKSITDTVDIEEWAKQADQYEAIRNDGVWNKTLQTYAVMGTDHPFSAVRVREILKWEKSTQYQKIRESLSVAAEGGCPNCHKPVDPDWQFCRHCGAKIK